MIDTSILVVRIIATSLTALIFIRVVISWVAPLANNPIGRLVIRLTEPVLGPIRHLLPSMGGIDFSAIFAIVGVQATERLLVQFLLVLAHSG